MKGTRRQTPFPLSEEQRERIREEVAAASGWKESWGTEIRLCQPGSERVRAAVNQAIHVLCLSETLRIAVLGSERVDIEAEDAKSAIDALSTVYPGALIDSLQELSGALVRVREALDEIR